MMDHILPGVYALQMQELNNIREKHGAAYNSLHEGFAVLMEDVEEVKEELDNVEQTMTRLWHITRADMPHMVYGCASQIAHYAAKAAAEAIQVAAVARKIADAYEEATANGN